MKWIFHPVYLSLIIIAVVIYLNRSELFTDTTQSGDVNKVVDKVDSLIDAMQAKPRASSISDIGNVQSGVNSDSGSGDFSSFNTAIPEMQNTRRPEETTSAGETTAAASADLTYESSRDTGNQSEVDPAETANKASEESELVVPESNEPATKDETHDDAVVTYSLEGSETDVSDGTVAEVHKGASQSLPVVSREQLLHTWQQARIAAWNGDVERAIEYYQTVIALQPDNYDAYGEMGNVMLRTGDREGAAEAYFQAARLLNKTPYRAMAWHLLNVIAWLSPTRAEKLHQELIQS